MRGQPIREVRGFSPWSSLFDRADLGFGVTAAVKRLDVESSQGEKEFITEIDLLSRLHHRSLVNLIGFCQERENCLLVYEYVPAGTLRDHIKDPQKSSQLSWVTRVALALDAAKGIEYLHRGANPPVVHRDIKSTNILLDHGMHAKVADFGLSRLLGQNGKDQLTHVTTGVKGTLGYLDPMYYRNHQLTEKSDVYSFGVVLLELMTGKMALWREEKKQVEVGSEPESYMPVSNPFETREKIEEEEEAGYISNLVEWALPSLKSGEIETILADNLRVDFPDFEFSLVAMARVAHACVQYQAKERPSMTDVVRGLEDCLSLVEQEKSGDLELNNEKGIAQGEDVDDAADSLPPILEI